MVFNLDFIGHNDSATAVQYQIPIISRTFIFYYPMLHMWIYIACSFLYMSLYDNNTFHAFIGTTNILYRYASHHTVSKKCPCSNATEKII